MATYNVGGMLQSIQHSVAKQDWNNAIDLISKVMVTLANVATNDNTKKPNLSTLLLSRSTCYMQLKDYESALQDALELLDTQPDELLPHDESSSISSHVAAASRIVEIYDKTGDHVQKKKYYKLLEELKKKHVKKLEISGNYKRLGNEAYKQENYEDAVKNYIRAVESEPTNSAVLANIVQAYLMSCGKLGREEKRKMLLTALDYAEKCTVYNPGWGKGWYRQGCVLMRLNRYQDACAAFQQGLLVDGENEELRKKYEESSRLARSFMSNKEKRMIGMMGELRQKSWLSKTNKLTYLSVSEIWDQFLSKLKIEECSPVNPPQLPPRLLNQINKFIYAAFPNKITYVCGPAELDETTWRTLKDEINKSLFWQSYIVPKHVLTTLGIFYEITRTTFPTQSWTIIFSLSIEPENILSFTSKDKTSPQSQSLLELLPFIESQRVYGFLANRETGTIIDVFGNWAYSRSLRKPAARESLVSTFVEISLLRSEGATVIDGLLPPGKIPYTFYTCEDTDQYLEFVETYFEMERAHNRGEDESRNDPKMENVTQFSPILKTDSVEEDNGQQEVQEEQKAAVGEVQKRDGKSIILSTSDVLKNLLYILLTIAVFIIYLAVNEVIELPFSKFSYLWK
ncbi:Stress-induced-phosphoprotein 1 [Nowakowskiella sp. JEL0407]|nr:Stress-induced-phosphoprotein 1 [Nowakowskiella sp. JEL0407]